MTNRPQFRMVNEHVYDGIPFSGYFPVEVLDQVKEFDLTGDIVQASYPKTGTTWVQEMLWLLQNDCDIRTANSKCIFDRFHFLELRNPGNQSSMERMSNDAHPRLIKTHLPVSFFKKQLEDFNFKLVIPIRNPKDTLVSLYHFYRMNRRVAEFTDDWNEFFEDLIRTRHLLFGDYFQWYTGWLEYRNHPNLKVVHYEDMKKNLRAVISDVANFLEKPVGDDKMDELLNHLSFSQMKSNKTTNFSTVATMDQTVSPFMRKGVIGDWKNYFSKEQSDYIDEEYKNTLERMGVNIQFE